MTARLYGVGILHSNIHDTAGHLQWVLNYVKCTESGFRYTPTTCFETFPFPRPTEEQREAIGAAAAELNRLREGWLNPDGISAAELRKRTLTNLYNARPTWLENIHGRLDAAVADAYGWPAGPGGRGDPGASAGAEPGAGGINSERHVKLGSMDCCWYTEARFGTWRISTNHAERRDI